VRGVNYFCRLATTISAGEGLAKERRWRPQRNSVIVAGRSLAVNAICLPFLSLITRTRMAVGASARPRGRHVHGLFGRGDRPPERVDAANRSNPHVRRGDRRSWGILSGRVVHDAASDRPAAAFPRRLACSVRKLGTSNSSKYRVMHQAIDGRGRRHLIPKNPIPLREDQIARDADGASLIAFGEEREKDLGLLGTLLNVPDVVQEQHREVIDFPQGAGQLEIPLRGQELLHEAVGRHEQHGVAAVDERVTDRTHRMALADARQAEGQHIGRILQEVAVGELVQAAHQRRRQAALVEGGEGLAGRAHCSGFTHVATRTLAEPSCRRASVPGASMVRSPFHLPGSYPRRTDTSSGRTLTGCVDLPFTAHHRTPAHRPFISA